MKWLRAIIIVIIIIIILICALLLTMLKSGKQEEIVPETYASDIIEITPSTPNLSTYFIIEDCIDKLLSYIQQGNSEAVYALINQEYIANNRITTQNVLAKINLSDIQKYKIKEISELVRKKSL